MNENMVFENRRWKEINKMYKSNKRPKMEEGENIESIPLHRKK